MATPSSITDHYRAIWTSFTATSDQTPSRPAAPSSTSPPSNPSYPQERSWSRHRQTRRVVDLHPGLLQGRTSGSLNVLPGLGNDVCLVDGHAAYSRRDTRVDDRKTSDRWEWSASGSRLDRRGVVVTLVAFCSFVDPVLHTAYAGLGNHSLQV
ncbi:hypothetical protein FB45DRAFT_262116 [Roridomyces roridus]|uniref:Uncharacterized protein n=1 Tax=Roridomyces roridus TaxID=1738132 RepID=A0AAD7FEK2_9AGAR|nr:hypothetical protein FB45DRAFT_262116 [Roridomyces roridus]